MSMTARDEALAHFGVQGMKWGVRKANTSSSTRKLSSPTGKLSKNYNDYKTKVHNASVGAKKTSITTKTGEKISVIKEPPSALQLAVAKLTNRKPEDNVSSMLIVDSSGKKVGSFQVWREGQNVARGEWLEIDKGSQGKGYSKAAIEGLLKASKNDKTIKEVRLQVPSNAAAAKHIYSGIGFKKDKDLGDTPMFGNVEDWMMKV